MVFCTAALIKASNTILKERIWFNRVDSEIVFPFFAARHGASVARRTGRCSARGAEFHLEFYQRSVTGGTRSLWTLLVFVVSKSFWR